MNYANVAHAAAAAAHAAPPRPPPATPAAPARPYLCVYASQIAVCIGANQHKKASEAVESMWQRVAPASFAAALRRNGLKTEDDIVSELIQRSDLVRGLVDRSLASCQTSAEVAGRYGDLTRDLSAAAPGLGWADARRVDDVVKRNLYTGYGNEQEDRTLRYVREALGMEYATDRTFYKKQCGVTEGGTPWFVGGKIDAISADRSTVIEVKNRVNRLFFRVPFYETVQVQAYLELLGVEKGALVECLRDSAAGAPQVNVVEFRRDAQLWAREIVPKLQGFVDFVEKLLADVRFQDRYLRSPRRSVLVLNFIAARLRR